MKRRAMPLPIDFAKNPWDKKVRELVRHGFTRAVVQSVTGLTIGQVNGRVQKGNLSLSLKWRRGETIQSQIILQRIDDKIGDVQRMRASIARLLRTKQIAKFKNYPRLSKAG